MLDNEINEKPIQPIRLLVFLNGPPRSGKDTLGFNLKSSGKLGPICHLLSFADPLKIGTHYSLGTFSKGAKDYEAVKDLPNDEFFGLTPRQAYISHAEKYMKIVYGVEIFGKLLYRKIERTRAMISSPLTVIFTDSGFSEETGYVISRHPDVKSVLLRLHRKGHDYAIDSRSYLYLRDMGLPNLYEFDLSVTENNPTQTTEDALSCIKSVFHSSSNN